MAKWNVHVLYWGGFTKSEEWVAEVRSLLEAQGWTDVSFGNNFVDSYIPMSGSVDGDEIDFTATGEAPNRADVDRVLARVGISFTGDVSIEPAKPDGTR